MLKMKCIQLNDLNNLINLNVLSFYDNTDILKLKLYIYLFIIQNNKLNYYEFVFY